MTGLTDSGTLARLAYQGLINLGVDADLVMQRSGLNPDQLYQANLRTKFSAQPLFWKAAVELSNDPCIGLHLGEKMPVYKGQILEYLFLSSQLVLNLESDGDGSRKIKSTFQVAEVTRPLMSVSRVCVKFENKLKTLCL